jgi:hypothetical protein
MICLQRQIVGFLLCVTLAAGCGGSGKATPTIPSESLGPVDGQATPRSDTKPSADETKARQAETAELAAALKEGAESGESPRPPAATPPLALAPVIIQVPTAPAIVKVTNPGAAKDRRILGYNAKTGDSQALSLLLNAIFTGPDGSVTALPTTQFKGAAKVTEVTGKNIHYLFTATDVDARDVPNQNKPAAEMKERLQVLRGLTIDAVMSSDGQISKMQITLPAAPPAAADVVKEMLSMLPTPLALPPTPVGTGATWTVTRPFLTNGIALTLIYTCKAVLGPANKSTITATIQVQGKAQSIGPDTNITSVTGAGELTTQLDSTKLFAAQKETLATELTLTQGAATAKIAMKFAPEIELAPEK